MFQDVATRAYRAGERIAVGVGSAQSAAVQAYEVMLIAGGGKMYVIAGDNPTAAATTSIPLADGEKFHMRLTPGQKVAAIRDSVDGTLHIIPVV